MAITSEEVNYLVYRYLQESGFAHSAFTFAHESLLARSSVVQTDVPPGTLIAFLQKGLQYVKIEQQIDASGDVVHLEAEASLLQPKIDLHKAAPPRQDAAAKHGRRESASRDASNALGLELDDGAGLAGESQGHGGNDGLGMDLETSGAAPDGGGLAAIVDPSRVPLGPESNSTGGTGGSAHFGPEEVVTLLGQDGGALQCRWSPVGEKLCTGGSDATARIWDATAFPEVAQSTQLIATETSPEASNRDVTALQWAPDAEHLAAGCYDGAVRMWHQDGSLVHTLALHKGPVFCLRWSRDGTRVLTGSYDKTAVLWDATTGSATQLLQHHTGPVLDVDWRADDKFATCSSDRTVLVYSMGRSAPDATFIGHQDEVNALRWKPADSVLASCSDDHTAKVWSLSQSHALADLRGHSKDVYTIEWGPASSFAKHLLATASFDTTVKLWDVERQEATLHLTRHEKPMSSLAFSPNGELLATGSLGGQVLLWSVRDGSVVKSYEAQGGIYNVSWSAGGDKLAVCSSDKRVAVLDCRQV